MKYRVSFLAVGLSVLLSPTVAPGQSSTAPAWVQHAWANEDGFSVRPYAVGVSQGHIYVTGRAGFYRNGATFDGVHLDSDSSHAFLVSYEDDGTQRWVRVGAFGDSASFFASSYAGFSLAVQDDRIYTSEGLVFIIDSGQLTAGGVSINAYTTDGAALQTTILGELHQQPGEWPGFAVGLGIDTAGNLYTAGIYRDTLLLAPDTLAPFPLEAPQFIGDVFLASYTAEGILRWSRRIGGPRHDVIAAWFDPHGAFSVDDTGNTYFGGFFSRGAVFGENQPGELALTHDAYALASYDAEGGLRWVHTGDDLSIGANAGPWHLAVDATGNLFVDWFVLSTGGVNTVTVGDTTFTDPGFGGEFLTKLAPDGALLWARQLKSDGNETVSDVTTDGQGHVYVSGDFDGIYLELEDTVLRKQDLQADKSDGFVAHYDDVGRLRWVGHAAGVGTQRVNAVAASASGDLYVAGEFEGTMRLGPTTLEGQAVSGLDLFVAKYDAATITAREDIAEVPESVALGRAYPNPFSRATTIAYTLPATSGVSLKVYDVLGREVATLVAGTQEAGRHEAVFEGAQLPSGVYFYRLEVLGYVSTGTLLLLK